jgi:predicted metal-dependent enzyme (double-stranded beta helix superfamily)
MSALAAERSAAVAATMEKVRAIAQKGVDRAAVGRMLDVLRPLAARGEFFTAAEYAGPAGEELQARYLLSEDAGRTFALYLNIMRPGRKIPPHNHTTWACIAGVEGVETNTVWKRTDDGKVPGKAALAVDRIVDVGPGTGIAFLGDDIHSVEIKDRQIRHLHMYGRALETLSERVVFDLDKGTYEVFKMTTKTKS